MTSACLRCRIAAAILAFTFIPLAHAELPQLDPVQMLGPDSTDAIDDPNQVPSPPFFGYSLAKATELMLQVHHDGKAVVSSGTREKAEHDVARLHAHGLWATLRQD